MKQKSCYFDINCFGKCFALSIGLIPVIIALASLQTLVALFRGADVIAGSNALHSSLLIDALHTPLVMAGIPVISAFPGAASFMEEFTTGFSRLILPRIQGGYRAYCRRKVISVALSGGLSLLIGIFLCYTVLMVAFLPLETKSDKNSIPENHIVVASQDNMESEQVYDSNDDGFSVNRFLMQERIPEIIALSVRFFVTGMFWALTGALISLLLSSKYIAYFSPFLLFYLLTILNERYLTQAYVLNPNNWLSLATKWPGGQIGFFLLAAISLVILSVTFSITLRRKLESE